MFHVIPVAIFTDTLFDMVCWVSGSKESIPQNPSLRSGLADSQLVWETVKHGHSSGEEG